MDRVVKNTAGIARATFHDVNGDPTATTGTPTVAATRDSDASAVTLGAVSAVSGQTGMYQVVVPVAATATLDLLTLTWSGTVSGVAQQVVTTLEVCGGMLFTVGQARADTDLANTTTYPTWKVEEYRTLAEQAFEDAAHVAYVPRYHRDKKLLGTGTASLLLSRRKIRAIRSVATTYPGQAATSYTATEIGELGYDGSRVLTANGAWPASPYQVNVAYEHGFDRPPERVSQAVLMLAKSWLIEGPVSKRTLSVPGEFGPLPLLTPGKFGSVFGIPEVDVTLQEYGYLDALL